jgi:hypothetical protein
MPIFMEPGNALKADRISALARRIEKPHLLKETIDGQAVILESTKLVQSAYCVIEKPMCIIRK